MINFRLKEIDKILPVGQEPNQYLSWYWLTDGELWLKFGTTAIYEYTQEALRYFEKSTPYNDYYLIRFIEDFTLLFDKISETIPGHFYELTTDLRLFWQKAQQWLDLYEKDDDKYTGFYFEEYHKLTSWITQRYFDSMHLVGGPDIGFFRRNENIRVVWQTDHVLENGMKLWTAKSGSYEMNYSEFIQAARDFGENFFEEMEKHLERVIAKEWTGIRIDKNELLTDHKQRKEDFYFKLSQLESGPTKQTNWEEIKQLYDRMLKEI